MIYSYKTLAVHLSRVGNSFLSRRRLIGLSSTLALVPDSALPHTSFPIPLLSAYAQLLSVRLTLVCILYHFSSYPAAWVLRWSLRRWLSRLHAFRRSFSYPSLIQAVVGSVVS